MATERSISRRSSWTEGAELARERDADAAGERGHPLPHDRRHLVRVRRPVDIDLEVVDLADGHVAPLAGDGAIGLDLGDHGPALAGLAEVERVGVAGICCSARRRGARMVVPEEGVREAGRGQLGCVERGMRRLSRLLPGERRALGRVGERDVHPATVTRNPANRSSVLAGARCAAPHRVSPSSSSTGWSDASVNTERSPTTRPARTGSAARASRGLRRRGTPDGPSARTCCAGTRPYRGRCGPVRTGRRR